MPNYTHSAPLGYKLNTGKQARQARVFRALSGLVPAGLLDCSNYPQSTGQNSSSVFVFPNGVRVLISYETALAFRHIDGSFVATPYGEYSRTSDRAVAAFAPKDVTRLEVDAFRDALRLACQA